MPNPDGSFTLYFGYMNSNWQQEFDIPIGPANAIEPGGPDQGQPTHFYPRRNPFLFTVRVAKDLGTQGTGLDADGQRPDRARLRLAQDRLPDRRASDLDRSGRRLRQPARRAADQRAADARGVRRPAPHGQGRRAGAADGGGRRPRQHPGAPARPSADRRRPPWPRSTGRPRPSCPRAGRGCGCRGWSIAATPRPSRSRPTR